MISIHQSQFLPWLPYFYKALKSDIFVILDDVQYQKNGVQNRNQIKTSRGAQWLTVPVSVSLGDSINKTRVADKKIGETINNTIANNYKRATYFEKVYGAVEPIFKKDIDTLHVLNNELLSAILSLMGVSAKIQYSSNLSTTQTKDDLVLEIIQHFGETEYISGQGALDYMDLEKFKKAGVSVYVSEFHYQEYPQLWNKQVGFVPNLSIIDLLCNHNDGAYDYIMSNGTITRVV